MEAEVGALWHRLITRAAGGGHSRAAVRLEEIAGTLGTLFRALGGDGGLEVTAADAAAHGARRSFLQRVAGTGDRVGLIFP